MRVQHNIVAMNSYRNYNNNTKGINKNLEKLSSGYKINRAGDDAAGLAISEKMRAQITGLEGAQKNAKDGISLVQTAEGALTEVHSMLNRMVSLAEQSANGTYADDVDREQLQKEVEQLRTEINRVAESSNFNGIKLLNGDMDAGSGATKIEVMGSLSSAKVDAQKGKYESTLALGGTTANDKFEFKTEGNKLNFYVSTGDKQYAVELEVKKDANDPSKLNLVNANGDVLKTDVGTGTNGEITATVMAGMIKDELNKSDLAKDFSITVDATNKFVFENTTAGTASPSIKGIDVTWTGTQGPGAATSNSAVFTVKSGTAATGMGVTTAKEAADAGRSFNAAGTAGTNVIYYDGTNLDDALFTINGHKFVVMSEAQAGTENNDNAGKGDGLSSDSFRNLGDVTVLLSEDATGGWGTEGGEHTAVNMRLISDITGLNAKADGSGIVTLTPGAAKKDAALRLQIGDTSDSFNQLNVSIADMHAEKLGIGDIDISTQTGASTAIDKIRGAINKVSDCRGTLGATQNRLEHTINNLSVMQENIQDAESTIRDTDVADEMMKYTKNSILVQSAQAMLAQANQQPQGVLQLLQ
jgi:flagellin